MMIVKIMNLDGITDSFTTNEKLKWKGNMIVSSENPWMEGVIQFANQDTKMFAFGMKSGNKMNFFAYDSDKNYLWRFWYSEGRGVSSIRDEFGEFVCGTFLLQKSYCFERKELNLVQLNADIAQTKLKNVYQDFYELYKRTVVPNASQGKHFPRLCIEYAKKS